jgi:hypothetical protein
VDVSWDDYPYSDDQKTINRIVEEGRTSVSGNKSGLDGTASEDRLYGTDRHLTEWSRALLAQAKDYFVGHSGAVAVMYVDGQMKHPMFLKSGHEGGPWGGTHRGGVPRGTGRGFTSGGPSEGNIATHVEGHASAIMWQRKLQRAYLIVDREMCSVCHRMICNTLPPGSILFIYSDAEGKTSVRSTHAS